MAEHDMPAGEWLDQHRGETVVVKFGGNAMVDDALSRAFAEDIVALQQAGLRPIVTHGGGPQISAELVARGIPSEFRGGLRVTSPDAAVVVRDVLARLGTELAAQLRAAGGDAIALAAESPSQGGALFAGRRIGTVVNGQPVDLGWAGEATTVDAASIAAVLDAGRIPVVSAMGIEEGTGDLLNINADSAAGSLAVAVQADWLLLLTDVAGLYRDWPNRDSLVTTIDTVELAGLLPSLEAGMIPKMAACLSAVEGGVGHAAIVDGRIPHTLLAEPFGTSGTTVTHPAEGTAP
ncbi:MAG TPA: acetylglutamate kinase [Terrimesophilobacter sp.]|nr:acetylglutamate kinase [Terrimesophilobacter sp.]